MVVPWTATHLSTEKAVKTVHGQITDTSNDIRLKKFDMDM